MHAQIPAFAGMLNPDVSTSDAGGQAPRLEDTRSWFRSIVRNGNGAEVRAITKGLLFQQIIICDGQALISPYLYSATTGFSPCLELRESSPVFSAFLREFDDLWSTNAPGEAGGTSI